MSYSFQITAETKDEAGKKTEEQLSQVVLSQPIHDRDRQAAQDAVEALVDTLADPGEDQCIYVSVSGSLSWSGAPADRNITGANVTISASLRTKAS